MSAPPSDPTPPPVRPLYPIPARTVRALAFTLPRPGPDEPETAWQDELQTALDALAALDPRNPIEAMLAVQIIAANAGSIDAYRLGFEPGAPAAQAQRHRANAAALARIATTTLRLLKQQKQLPVGPPRDWGTTVQEQAEAWRQAPARPAESPHAGKPDAAADEVIVKWIDEIDDKELVIAIEQERREKSGLPELPRKPGTPKVIYRYKPEDYIHKFKPDPKNFQPYPGYENMTMSERRDFFGYHYDGPLGPPDALSPASRDAMLAQMATDEILKQEYGK